MKISLKRYIALFLVCTLFLAGGVFNAAMAHGGSKTYKVTYVYDGAPRGTNPPNHENRKAGETVTLPTKPENGNYAISDWAVSAGRSTIAVENNAFVMPKCDVTVRCCWTRVYSITFEYAQGSPSAAPAQGVIKSEAGKWVTLPVPTLAGYTFKGWDLKGDHLNVTYTKIFMPAYDLNFVGSWDAIAYDVTYHAGGDIPTSYTDPAGGTYDCGTEVTCAAVQTVDGYTFSGWTATNTQPDANGKFIMPAGNVDFTGTWAKGELTVTYSSSGQKPDGYSDPAPQSAVIGNSITRQDPQAYKGYTFSGWQANVELNYGDETNSKVFTMPGTNVVFTGTWTKDAVPEPTPPPQRTALVITYSYVGSVPAGAPAAPALDAYYAGTVVKVAPVPTMAGYVFSGWSTTDVTVTNGAFTLITNVRFTGSWMAANMTSQVPSTGDAPALLFGAALMLAGVAGVCLPLARRKREK